MAKDFIEGDRAGCLSEQAKRLYAAIAAQEWELVDTLQTLHPNARRELLTWELISDENPPVARDPQKALRTMVSRELEEARRRIELVETMPALSRDLIRDYRQVQLHIPGGTSVYLPEQAEVNARLKDVIGDARRELLCAQPGGPRKREILETAVTRDSAALDRGVQLRTIYRDTVRDHPLTAEYARTMSTRTSGRPARYATSAGDFERMVIVDREQAFVTNHVVEGAGPHSAWLVTDPAVVAVLAGVFDAMWRRAQPWSGELRSRTKTAGGAVAADADGVRTDRRQRSILRFLCAGDSQDLTARKMGVPKRSLQAEIAVLKGLWGVRTLPELIYQYALSPDRLVDDEGDRSGGGLQGLTGLNTGVTTETAETAA